MVCVEVLIFMGFCPFCFVSLSVHEDPQDMAALTVVWISLQHVLGDDCFFLFSVFREESRERC